MQTEQGQHHGQQKWGGLSFLLLGEWHWLASDTYRRGCLISSVGLSLVMGNA